jgi:hypothetical protein
VQKWISPTSILECFGRPQACTPRNRAAAVAGAVGLLTAVKPARALDALSDRVPPLWNHETTQWVVMRPASGQLEAWARTGS